MAALSAIGGGNAAFSISENIISEISSAGIK